MDTQFILEIIGYIGSLLVIVSMLNTKMIRLRAYNALGSAFSAFYALMISSYPVFGLNIILLFVNLYYILRHYTKKRTYDVIDTEIAGYTLRHFLNKYRQDVLNLYPKFFLNYPDFNYAKVVFCDDIVVGLIVGRKENNKLNVYLYHVDHNYLRKDLICYIQSIIQNDNIKKIVFWDVPGKKSKLYLKFGCKADGANFIYSFDDKNN